jgi:hypothetical protein
MKGLLVLPQSVSPAIGIVASAILFAAVFGAFWHGTPSFAYLCAK